MKALLIVSVFTPVVSQAVENKYTDVIVINEDNRVPNGLLLSHLPDGPTAHFKLSNVKISKEIRRDYREITAHRPEVILNNFTTRLGHTVARMMACLFHYDPEFRGKRAVTFHNQAKYTCNSLRIFPLPGCQIFAMLWPVVRTLKRVERPFLVWST